MKHPCALFHTGWSKWAPSFNSRWGAEEHQWRCLTSQTARAEARATDEGQSTAVIHLISGFKNHLLCWPKADVVPNPPVPPPPKGAPNDLLNIFKWSLLHRPRPLKKTNISVSMLFDLWTRLEGDLKMTCTNFSELCKKKIITNSKTLHMALWHPTKATPVFIH